MIFGLVLTSGQTSKGFGQLYWQLLEAPSGKMEANDSLDMEGTREGGAENVTKTEARPMSNA